MTTSGSY